MSRLASEQQREQEDGERGELGVQRMLAQAGAGMFQRARVGDPENQKAEQRACGCWNEAVGQHAEPGVELAHLLPPLIIDGPGAEETRDEEQDGDDDNNG